MRWICEELGFFLGAIAVLSRYLWSTVGVGMRAAARPRRTDLGACWRWESPRWVLCQALINFAVVLGMVPTKGDSALPFISYGGSSLLVHAAGYWRSAEYFATGGGSVKKLEPRPEEFPFVGGAACRSPLPWEWRQQ